MPQKNARGIDVSEEEERFLRQAFRRFALPYVLVFAALAWGASLLGGSDAAGVSTEAWESHLQEVAALQAQVSALEERLASLDSDVDGSRARVAALEKRVETDDGKGDPALERRVREAIRRIDALDKALADQAAVERLDALSARMARIEQDLRSPTPAAPSARQAAPPSSPPAGPTP